MIFSASDVTLSSSPRFSDSSITDVVSRISKFSPASTSRPSPTCLSRFPWLPPVKQGRVNGAELMLEPSLQTNFRDQDILSLNQVLDHVLKGVASVSQQDRVSHECHS